MNAPPLSIWRPEVRKPITSAKEIIEKICRVHGVNLIELRGTSQVRKLARARMHAYHALREYGLSTTAIGTMLNRDHSTVVQQSQKWPKFAKEYANG